MRSDKPLEIERKYLIRMPDEAVLSSHGKAYRLTQTYLTGGPNGENRRVRKTVRGDCVTYTYTQKTRLTALSCIEEERALTEEEYTAILAEAREDSAPVHKTRWRLPYGTQVLEVDIYPFWQEVAVLEVELTGEDEAVRLPPWISLIREVTGEGRYKNTQIAVWLRNHPGEPLPI